MRRLTRLFALSLLAFSTSSCSYALLMSLEPTDPNQPTISTSEQHLAAEVVGTVAIEYGLKKRVDPEYAQVLGRQSPSSEFYEVDRYGRDPELFGNPDGALLVIGVNKRTGSFEVLVRDFDSFDGNSLTDALVPALQDALHRSFPSRRIEVTRLKDLPIFFVP